MRRGCDQGVAGNHHPQPLEVSIFSVPPGRGLGPVCDLRPVQTTQGPCWISGVPGPQGALIGLSVVLAATGFTAHTPQSWAAWLPAPGAQGSMAYFESQGDETSPWMRQASCPRGPGPWRPESLPCPPGAWVQTPSPQQPPHPGEGGTVDFCFPPSSSAGLFWAQVSLGPPEGDVSERARRASTGSLSLLCPTDPAGQAPGWAVC